MANLAGFDAHQVEPSANLEPLPAGKYLVAITESELKPTRAGDGQYLQFTFQVLDGRYQGRFLWSRLNLDNPNATAVQIARGELSAICRAVGVMTPQDSAELHNLPLIVTVRCKKRAETGEIDNEISGYAQRDTPPGLPTATYGSAPASGFATTPPVAATAPPGHPTTPPSPAATAPVGSTPPWLQPPQGA